MGIAIAGSEPSTAPLCRGEEESSATVHVTWYEHYDPDTAAATGEPGIFCSAAMPPRYAASFVRRWRQLDGAGRAKMLGALWFYWSREEDDRRYDPEWLEREWPDCRRADFLRNVDCSGFHAPDEIAAETAEHAGRSVYLGAIPAA